MLSAISIFAIEITFFIIYGAYGAFSDMSNIEEMHALVVGVFLLASFACIPSFIWNLMMSKDRGKKNIVGIVFASLAFLGAAAFLVYDYVERIHASGLSVFGLF